MLRKPQLLVVTGGFKAFHRACINAQHGTSRQQGSQCQIGLLVCPGLEVLLRWQPRHEALVAYRELCLRHGWDQSQGNHLVDMAGEGVEAQLTIDRQDEQAIGTVDLVLVHHGMIGKLCQQLPILDQHQLVGLQTCSRRGQVCGRNEGLNVFVAGATVAIEQFYGVSPLQLLKQIHGVSVVSLVFQLVFEA